MHRRLVTTGDLCMRAVHSDVNDISLPSSRYRQIGTSVRAARLVLDAHICLCISSWYIYRIVAAFSAICSTWGVRRSYTTLSSTESLKMPYEEQHANPEGPGDARPTALQIVEDEGCAGNLGDRVVIVTGASSGIGIETARALYVNGATVYMPVRNIEKGKAVAEEMQSKAGDSAGKLEVMQMDLDSLASVRAFAEAFLAKETKLNLLINNAGNDTTHVC